MGAVHIKFSPSILARLGEELNQSVDQSILELVKNSYDADATLCKIEFANTAAPGGTVRISDDGHGMDQSGIRDGWLVLGRSAKAIDRKTSGGRVPAGSKGLGRLAALRLGRSVNLQSIKKGESRRAHTLKIDWKDFEDASAVEDVDLTISTAKHTGGGHGTSVELLDLRNAIRKEEIKRLARALLLLTDPFSDGNAGFSIELSAPEFRDIENLVRQKYFEDADYHLHAELDQAGRASLRLLDWRGEKLAEADHAEIRGPSLGEVQYEAPPCTFDFWMFLLKGNSFLQGRTAGVTVIREWLGHFGGVHVYHEGVRVAPYGDHGDDWLRLNLARARSPEERPSTNNSIGKLVVRSDPRYQLIQKTDRSGFIENDAFTTLTQFAKDCLDWVAKWRLAQAELRRQSERHEAKEEVQKGRDSIEQALLKIPGPARSEVAAAFKEYERKRDRETDALRREVQLYRTLSTAGITAATFAHEVQGNPIKVIGLSITSLRTRILRVVAAHDREPLLDLLSKMKSASSALSTLGAATLGLVEAEKRRVGRVEIHGVVSRLVRLLEPFWSVRGTDVIVELSSGSPYLRSSEAAIESILANLMNNALDAFRRGNTEDRKIRISTTVVEKMCILSVDDSGPGITDVSLNDIWLPGITSDANGTGLGLTIVRDTVKDLGGTVAAESHGELGGASFHVSIPILGH